jgi:polyhydroxyalkanoate synthase subunit PhaC
MADADVNPALKERSDQSATAPMVPAGRVGLQGVPSRAHFAEIQPFASHHTYVSIDRAFKATLARLTFGLSPAVLAEQTFDWLAHLAISPGKQLQLAENALRGSARLAKCAGEAATPDSGGAACIEPLPQDRRFQEAEWQQWPYNLIYQTFLTAEQWWENATTGVDGVSQRNERRLSFTVRQFNYIWTNPEVTRKTLAQGGRNLAEGWQNFIEDWSRAITGKPPVGAEQFVVGRNVGITPGKVVFQNRLVELIQ